MGRAFLSTIVVECSMKNKEETRLTWLDEEEQTATFGLNGSGYFDDGNSSLL